MKIIKGVVKNLQLKEETRGVKYYLALFDIEDKRVRIKLPSKIEIKNGDIVALAGESSFNFLNAFAYKNLTSSKVDSNRNYLSFFLGLLEMILAFVIIIFENIFGGILAKIFAFILLTTGFYFMIIGLKNYFFLQKIKYI